MLRLLTDRRLKDLLLIEEVGRLSRLTETEWRKLRAELEQQAVTLDLSTSRMFAIATKQFASRIGLIVSDTMLDTLSPVTCGDYEK